MDKYICSFSDTWKFFVIKNFNHLHHNAIEKQEEENNENFFLPVKKVLLIQALRLRVIQVAYKRKNIPAVA